MFDPTLTEAGMRTALKAADATIVGGPNETDAYVLAVPAGGLQKSLSALRAANAKFERRFRSMEMSNTRQDIDFMSLSLDEMEALWQQAKAEE